MTVNVLFEGDVLIEFGIERKTQSNCLALIHLFKMIATDSVARFALELSFHALVQVVNNLVLEVLILFHCFLHVSQSFENALRPVCRRRRPFASSMDTVLSLVLSL